MSVEERKVGRAWPPISYLVIAGAALFALRAVLGLLWMAKTALFLAFMGVLASMVLRVPLEALARRMPRPLAALVTLLGVLALCFGLGALLRPLFFAQAHRVIEGTPAALAKLRAFWADVTAGSPIDLSGVGAVSGAWVGRVVPLATTFVSGVSGMIYVFVMGMFLAYGRGAYAASLLRVVPARWEPVAAELLARLGRALGGWVIGTVVLMAVVGVSTALGLLLVGIEGWLVLGVLMFFGEFIPFVGPVVGAIPGILIGLAQSPTKAVYAALVYLAVQQLESHILQPIVMRRAVDVGPALLLTWGILMAVAFGLLGVLIATPLLACVQVAVQYLWIERALGK